VYQKFADRELFSPHPRDADLAAKRIGKSGITFKGVALVLGLAVLLSALIVWKYQGKQPGGLEDAARPPASVVIYATPTCPYCNVAKAFFEKHDIDYFEVDITSSEEGRRSFRDLNGRGVPLIFVGDTRIDGYNEQLLRNALRRTGLL
jgi:glutaredoxin